jgi:hypothetical protein
MASISGSSFSVTRNLFTGRARQFLLQRSNYKLTYGHLGVILDAGDSHTSAVGKRECMLIAR